MRFREVLSCYLLLLLFKKNKKATLICSILTKLGFILDEKTPFSIRKAQKQPPSPGKEYLGEVGSIEN